MRSALRGLMKTIGLTSASHAVFVAIVLITSLVHGESAGPLDVQGITLSTHRGGRELGDPEVLRPSLDKIKQTGANWIAYHPYARIQMDGTVSARHRSGDAAPSHWTEPIKVAREKGIKVCVKPHLAHWRSGFSWRGEITFGTPQEWARFWKDYSAWIVAMAEACSDADIFVVGTELDRTVSHEKEWRELIHKVRQKTSATITFASNWDAFEKVPFWDALNLVGIQSYFPISKERNPERKTLEAGWQELANRLSRYSKRVGKPVVLTELGYNQSFKAAAEPWTYPVDSDAEPLQLRCMSVALSAIETEPSIVGAFLWKWFPEPRPVGRNFQLATDGMKWVIAEVWLDN